MNKINWRFKNNELKYVKKLLNSDLSLDVSMNQRLRDYLQKFTNKNLLLPQILELPHYIKLYMLLVLGMAMKL